MSIIANVGLAPATGKTATAVHLAEQLGTLGARVLLVDLAPDADATAAIRQTRTVDLRRVLQLGLPLETCVAPTILPHVDLLTLPNVPLSEVFRGDAAHELPDVLRRAASEYAYVLIDLPPEEGLSAEAALAVADAALVPAPVEDESLDDVSRAMELIRKARVGSNPSLRTLILLTVVAPTSEARRVQTRLRDTYPDVVLTTRIPADEALNDLLDGRRNLGVPSPGMNAYHQLASELASRLSGAPTPV
jgi:chromosome partitioning protein